MSKRIVIRVAIVLAGLTAVLMLTVSVLVKRADLDLLIAEYAQKATGAKVAVESVSVNWWGGVGLTLRGVSIKGSGKEWPQRHGAGSTNLEAYSGTITKIVVRTGLSDLLRGVYVPCAVRLEAEQLMVVISGDQMSVQNFELDLKDLMIRAEDPTLNDLEGFDFALNCAEYAGQETQWSDVALNGSWSAKQLKVPQLIAHLGEGVITADLILDWQNEGPGEISGVAQLDNVPSGMLLTPYWPNLGQRLDCALQGEVAGSMLMSHADVRRQSLDLRLKLGAGAGELDGRAWLHDATQYLGDRQDLKIIAFDRLQHEAQIAAGRYDVNFLEISGSETEWKVMGWVEFAGDVMLGTVVRLPAGFTPELGSMAILAEMMRDSEGRINLAANIAGPIAAPIVTPDINQMLQRR